MARRKVAATDDYVPPPPEPEAPAPAAPTPEAPSIGESLARGAGEGLTFGGSGELEGIMTALMSTRPESKMDLYRRFRDEAEAKIDRARQNPKAFMLGEMGGGLATAALPIGAAAKGAGLAAKVGRGAAAGAGLGALSGAGASKGDLTQGQALQVLQDLGIGAGVGGALGAVGPLIGGAGSALARRGKAGIEKAEQKIAEQAAAKQAKAEASALGTYRAETQKASRQLENLIRASADESIDPSVRQAAADMLASEEGRALRETVLKNTMREAPRQMGKVDETLAELLGLQGKAGENIAKDIAKGKSIKETIKTQVSPRLATMGSRIVPPLLGALGGGLLGGGAGMGAGTGLGTLLALTMGNPTIVMRNMARAPSVQRAASIGLERLGEATARGAPEAGRLGSAAARQAVIEQLLGPMLEEPEQP